MKIIPAIDLQGGCCVRLAQGDFHQKTVYASDPLEQALIFERSGATHLHLVDLDGAKSQSVVHLEVLEKIAKHTQLILDFGGGIKTETDLKKVLDAGAQQVTLGSIAVNQPEWVQEWGATYGYERFILGADVRGEQIATHGWLTQTDHSVFNFIASYSACGFRQFMVTDIAKDGMLSGPSVALYQKILANYPIELIASGGVSSYADVQTLREIGCAGTIIGKALYEGIMDLHKLLQSC